MNPMLGHRGCRLGVSYPEIYEMQVRAIIEAACEVVADGRPAPIPEIMHPLVAKGEEMKFLRELTRPHGEGGPGRAEASTIDYHGRHHDRTAPRRASAPATWPSTPSSSPSAPTT